jgi:hypothetical protein
MKDVKNIKKISAFAFGLILNWALHSYATEVKVPNRNKYLKANIISFAMDSKLNLVPRGGEITIENEALVLVIEKTGLTCLATNCKTSTITHQIYKAPIVEIYLDNCKNTHYKAYGNDALVNDQELFIEVVDYANSECPVFISDAPTEIILRTSLKSNYNASTEETFSEMVAEILIEKKNQ